MSQVQQPPAVINPFFTLPPEFIENSSSSDESSDSEESSGSDDQDQIMAKKSHASTPNFHEDQRKLKAAASDFVLENEIKKV